MSEEFNDIDWIAGLIIKYHREEITKLEFRELMDWLDQSNENRALFEKLSHPDYVRNELKELPDVQALKREGWEKVRAVIGEEDPAVIPLVTRRIHRTRYIIAA